MATKKTEQEVKEVKLTLWQKLVEVQKVASYLKKDNAGYQFQYVSSSQTLGTLRNKMDELGLLLIPKVMGTNIKEHKDKKGNLQFLTELDMLFVWLNSENPEEVLEVPFYAQGVDNAEKGVGKALTYGEKYFLLKFFHIATDKDDPDAFQQKHAEQKPEQPKPTLQAPTQVEKMLISEDRFNNAINLIVSGEKSVNEITKKLSERFKLTDEQAYELVQLRKGE